MDKITHKVRCEQWTKIIKECLASGMNKTAWCREHGISVGGIEGLCVITPTVHGDARGYFMETYNQKDMEEAGLKLKFVQDNQSCSIKGVLRGLHFQKQFPQGKLVRVVRGTVFDVAVDLRSKSKTFGKWFGIELTEENKKQFYIPEGKRQILRSLPNYAPLFIGGAYCNIQLEVLSTMA